MNEDGDGDDAMMKMTSSTSLCVSIDDDLSVSIDDDDVVNSKHKAIHSKHRNESY